MKRRQDIQCASTLLNLPLTNFALQSTQQKNALDMAMFEGIRDTAKALQGDTSVRAVILRGAGSAFSSGLDVKSGMPPVPHLDTPFVFIPLLLLLLFQWLKIL